MPIRSPRRLYEIEEIVKNLDDVPDAVDPPNGTVSSIFIKMKEAIGEYLGLEPIAYGDPRMVGEFGGEGLNKGSLYRRNLGGFRVASYTLIAKTFFVVNEQYYDSVNKNLVQAQGKFRTMSIGFPKGHSVHEVVTFLGGANNFSNIAALRTPAGRRIDLYDPT